MGTQGGGPPNKWQPGIHTEAMTSDEFGTLLNNQAAAGYTNVVVKRCIDGEFTFFGNYDSPKKGK